MSADLEDGLSLDLDFTKVQKIAATGAEVVPVVLQDADDGTVLFLAYANRLALDETLAQRVAVLWSTSRDELWVKGATSGDVLDVVDVRVNCEQNSLLYRVRPRTGGACHTVDDAGAHRTSCYYRTVQSSEELTWA